MIAKKYRLSERDIRKVFLKKKPFFSYGFVANVRPNLLGHARVAIMLSGKITRWSVNRNTFRRTFYDLSNSVLHIWCDIVIIPKKWNPLSHKNPQDIEHFSQAVASLYQQIISTYATIKNS